MSDVLNLVTVDCEEWFVAEALAGRYTHDDWDHLPSTVVNNCRVLLDIFYHHRVKATWFMLGWVADRHKDLLQEIINEGHEIACHSYYHHRVDQLTQEQFRDDTTRAIDAIIKATGNRPIGYRAPSWSINQNTPWAFEVLADLGFEYDSSIFPIKHDFYGVPQGPRTVFELSLENGKSLVEVPASTHRSFGQNIPVGGGGYLRHMPYWFTRLLIKRMNKIGQPVVTYIHPWELDPNPPRIEGLSTLQKIRTYGSTSILLRKFDRLLSDFPFITMSEYIRNSRKRPIGFR